VFPLADPHQPTADADRHEAIVLLALGESVDAEFAAHVATCQRCQRDLDGYSHVVGLAGKARSTAASQQRSPATRLEPDRRTTRATSRIRVSSKPGGARISIAPRSRRLSRRALAIAAAAVIASGVAIGGFTVGRSTSSSSSSAAAQATLRPQPGGPTAVAGTATVTQSADGSTLAVTTAGLPARNGFYEVWLYNPAINRMVAVGTLGDDDRGSFTVPAGLDLTAYHVVDVSAQNYDGNPPTSKAFCVANCTSDKCLTEATRIRIGRHQHQFDRFQQPSALDRPTANLRRIRPRAYARIHP
jgi:hypothetical protein